MLLTRRQLLTWLAAAGGLAAVACRADPTPALREEARKLGSGLDCSDTTLLSAAELVTRTSNDYRQHTERDDQFCLNCLNYVPPPAPGRCASCKTVKGPINPDGWCKQWTEKRT